MKKQEDKKACLIIYVDDMIITGDDFEEIEKLKKNFFNEFEMNDLGNLKYFIGIELPRLQRSDFLRQTKYIPNILAEIGLNGL